MNLKILWMYHDLMDLYGDKGNAEVLRRRAEKRGIEVQLDTCTIGEEKNIDEYDLFFLGGGADKEQNLIFADLLQRKQSIQTAMDHKTAFLLICGGYQLFGQYYKDQDGNVMKDVSEILRWKQQWMVKHSKPLDLKIMADRQRMYLHHLRKYYLDMAMKCIQDMKDL